MNRGATPHHCFVRLLRRMALLGSAFSTALFLCCWLAGGLSYLGQQSETATTLVKDHFLMDYLLCNGRLLGLAVVLGALLGCYALMVLYGCGLQRRRPLVRSLFLVVLLSLLALLVTFLSGPQLFIEPYLGGGWKATVLTWIYDHGHPQLFLLLLGLSLPLALRGVWTAAGLRIALLLLALVTFLGWWTFRPIIPHGGKGGNVVLLLVDSLRSDRISGLGYERETTPELDGRLKDAAIFPQTYVPLPRTLPSLVSLLTGSWPQKHGIRTMFPSHEALAAIPDALPQRLREGGFATLAVADYAGEVFHDLPVGFEKVIAPDFNFKAIYRQRSLETQWLLLAWLNNRIGRLLLPDLALLPNNSDPEALVDRVLAATDDLPEPFFLTVFMSATHFPYTARYPDDRLFSATDYRGPYRFATPFFLPTGHQRSPADIDQVNALYDGALHGADRALGRLLRTLEGQGYLDDSLVLLSGDHGENLYEPGAGLGHGDHFYGGLQSVRVPLLIWGGHDRLKPGLYPGQVRSIDLAPTLLELLRLPPLVEADGQSLLQTAIDRPVYSETGLWMDPANTERFAQQRLDYPGILTTAEIDFTAGDEVTLKRKYRHKVITAKHRLLIEEGWGLLYLPTRSGVRYELYNLALDPTLQTDRAAFEPERLALMLKHLLTLLELEPNAEVRRDYVLFPD